MRELAARGYVDPVGGTVDCVMMFIPDEQLFGSIQHQDPGLLGAFWDQWERFTQQLEGMGAHLDQAQRAYDALLTTRRRALERPLDRIEDLRRARPRRL